MKGLSISNSKLSTKSKDMKEVEEKNICAVIFIIEMVICVENKKGGTSYDKD